MPEISIHALREEGDDTISVELNDRDHFYPRPPRGGRHTSLAHSPILLKFLSTPSARRATRLRLALPLLFLYFYPRPPRGGRHAAWFRMFVLGAISIHALREEGDATFCGKPVESVISIHALREEGDLLLSADSAVLMYFYPRPPRGGRRFWLVIGCHLLTISIHALREEGDNGGNADLGSNIVFLSTPSARRATIGDVLELCVVGISIHALREEGDLIRLQRAALQKRFLSTPSARRATGR